MGRLNVIALGPKNNESTLLWRLVGEQGDEWKPATVKLDSKYMADVYKVNMHYGIVDLFRLEYQWSYLIYLTKIFPK